MKQNTKWMRFRLLIVFGATLSSVLPASGQMDMKSANDRAPAEHSRQARPDESKPSEVRSQHDRASTVSTGLIPLNILGADTREDQPKPRSAQQARHKGIRFAFGAASAPLRPAS